MFNLGPTEMIFVMVVLLVLFGAKRLPELGSGLGRGIREFKKSMRDINADIDASTDSQQQIHPGNRTTMDPGAAGPAEGAAAPTRTEDRQA
jgi:sec-independent protein translocase protein TatA